MHVRVEVLEGRGCLAGIGSHPDDKVVVRVGRPNVRNGVHKMASATVDSPVVGLATGVAMAQKLSDDIKCMANKPPHLRDPDKYQLRLYTVKHDGQEPKWLGIVGFRLVRLLDGYVTERWVPMKPATKTEPGSLRVRVVVRESEEAALAVFKPENVLSGHTTASEGCCCDACDPDFALTNPLIEYFVFDEDNDFLQSKTASVVGRGFVALCAIS